MTTNVPSDVTFKDIVKTMTVALEARYHLVRARRLKAAYVRHATRQQVLTKWLWEELFKRLKRELAMPKRDTEQIAMLVAAMRKLVPPPPGRFDRKVGFGPGVNLGSVISDAFTRARQQVAEQQVASAVADESVESDEQNSDIHDRWQPRGPFPVNTDR